jgi:hypothetical protein
MISASADDIVIIAKHRGNLNRINKKVEIEFSRAESYTKLKKKCKIIKIMKKAI